MFLSFLVTLVQDQQNRAFITNEGPENDLPKGGGKMVFGCLWQIWIWTGLQKEEKTPLQRRLGDLRLEASSQSGPGTGKQTSQDGGNVTVWKGAMAQEMLGFLPCDFLFSSYFSSTKYGESAGRMCNFQLVTPVAIRLGDTYCWCKPAEVVDITITPTAPLYPAPRRLFCRRLA